MQIKPQSAHYDIVELKSYGYVNEGCFWQPDISPSAPAFYAALDKAICGEPRFVTTRNLRIIHMPVQAARQKAILDSELQASPALDVMA